MTSPTKPSCARSLFLEFNKCEAPVLDIPASFSDPNADKTALTSVFTQMLAQNTDEDPYVWIDEDSLCIAFPKLTSIIKGPALLSLCECLHQYPSIHTLSIQECHFSNEAWEYLLNAVASAKQLVHLAFDSCRLTPEHIGAVVLHPLIVQQILSFSCYNCSIETWELWQTMILLVSKTPQLKELAFENCGLNDDMMAAFHLLSLVHLTNLNMSKNHIRNEGAYHLAFFLEKCPALNTLDLSENEISSAGLQGLARGLQKHPAKLHLRVKQNDPSMISVGVVDLIKFIPHLTVLDVSGHNRVKLGRVIKRALETSELLQLDGGGTAPFSDIHAEKLLRIKKRRTTQEPLQVQLQGDHLSQKHQEALLQSNIGAIFHITVQYEHLRREPFFNLLTSIKEAPAATQELLDAVKQLPTATEQDKSGRLACYYGLFAKQFDIVPMARDGNCLFEAFVQALKNGLDHAQLREQTVEYIAGHQDEFIHFFASEDGKDVDPLALLKRHCGVMLLDKTWAGQVELAALYELLKSKGISRSIVVYDMNSLAIQQSTFVNGLVWGNPDREESIHLFYENNSHYTLLRRKA